MFGKNKGVAKPSSRSKSREQEILKGVRYRNRIIIFLGCSLMLAIGGLVRAPHTIDVYTSPDARYGSLHEQGDVPPTAVYSFASYIFTILNTWSKDGEIDYKAQASALNAYLSPAYFQFVYDDADARLDRTSQNQLKGRTRTVTPADGSSYSASAVKIIGPDSWVVYLDLHIEERLDSIVVKDSYVRYPIRVIKRQISRERNPWQLALDGYYKTPERLLVNDKTAQLE